jgi:acyl-coenzyme A synthetase/AMP-(fatty) acid ligase
MKAQSRRIALALAAALIGVSPLVSGTDVGPTANAARARAGNAATLVAESGYQTEESAPAQPRTEDGRANRNSPHPAVQSFERPVYPIGVPNPPVGLERY